ncbi:MAG: CZB domain-containing protein [Oscillospiraceae bacterium]|nr:CZB domain-containing protein [Oscillospiraceae bacterium]
MGIDVTKNINEQLQNLRGVNMANTNTDASDGESEVNYPYVILQIFENNFAVNCKYVMSIEQSAETMEIANISQEIRGIAYYKNEAINVFDMRKLFGYMNQRDYITNVIDLPQRIREHETYFETLKECVETGNPFTLTVDPHECKFGKWFYSNKDEASVEILSQIHRVEPIHNKFHKTAETVKNLINEGRLSEAAETLIEAEKIKSEIVEKLEDLHNTILNNIKELMVVLKIKNSMVGIIVDNAESVESINEIQELPPAVVSTKYVKRMGIRKKDQKIILILEAADFL